MGGWESTIPEVSASRFVASVIWAPPQTTDPGAANYVSASSNGDGRIDLSVSNGGMRPWNLIITAEQRGGYLKECETITIIFGDTHSGSPGMLMQTFAESGCEFRVMTDVQATGNFLPLSNQLWVPIVAGPVHVWKAVLPTLRRPNETFQLGIKAEDIWGNPTQPGEREDCPQPLDAGQGTAGVCQL